jgi:hypothetical protein
MASTTDLATALGCRIDELSTAAGVQAAWRRAAAAVHPDRAGGSQGAFVRAAAARDLALARLGALSIGATGQARLSLAVTTAGSKTARVRAAYGEAARPVPVLDLVG